MNSDVDIYLRVRQQEGRLYSDETVKQLPLAPSDHPLRYEWRARAASSNRLTAYLRRHRNQISILELGCGNGWLSNTMATAGNAFVVGLDRDSPELRQAQRVFSKNENLRWVTADIYSAPFATAAFDFVVIASAIQYFENLPKLIATLVPLLTPTGEVHILDSPLYSADELAGARERSRSYYERLGCPEMAGRYHHHAVSSLDAYNPVWLYVPDRVSSAPRDQMRDSPFPWVCLRPER